MKLAHTRLGFRRASWVSAVLGLSVGVVAPAAATPALVIDVASGDVVYQADATRPWFPASLTKLMTVYLALSAIRDKRISPDTPLVVSPRAASMAPSKMGFAPGTQVTLDNALKMMMVKSANDLAISIAEGVGGSVEAFADDMNAAAAELGMQQSHFMNPNGLPDARHFSSARDMALLARALYMKFPDRADLFGIGALSLGGDIITNHNNMLGRYPGVDGMKTGYTCAAGFNVVASAYRGGRRFIAVVLGAPSVAQRTMKTAVLLDRAFAGVDRRSGPMSDLPPVAARTPDPNTNVCRAHGKVVAQFAAEIEQLSAPLATVAAGDVTSSMPERSFFFDGGALSRPAPMAARIAMVPNPVFEPVPVYVGPAPGYVGPVAQARPAHSPPGTEAPPATASAYAATVAPEVDNPALKPDAAALPMKARSRPIAAKKPAAKPNVTVATKPKPQAKAVAAKAETAKTKTAKVDPGKMEPGKTEPAKAAPGKPKTRTHVAVKLHSEPAAAGKSKPEKQTGPNDD